MHVCICSIIVMQVPLSPLSPEHIMRCYVFTAYHEVVGAHRPEKLRYTEARRPYKTRHSSSKLLILPDWAGPADAARAGRWWLPSCPPHRCRRWARQTTGGARALTAAMAVASLHSRPQRGLGRCRADRPPVSARNPHCPARQTKPEAWAHQGPVDSAETGEPLIQLTARHIPIPPLCCQRTAQTISGQSADASSDERLKVVDIASRGYRHGARPARRSAHVAADRYVGKPCRQAAASSLCHCWSAAAALAVLDRLCAGQRACL